MFHVGLDIHSRRISICVLNGTGQVVHRSQVRGLEEMLAALKGLPDRFEVCYEASCGYGHYHDLLRPIAARVTVAHPGRLRLIFRSKDKNDRKDAERLAKLLYLGEAPAVNVPSPTRLRTPTTPTQRSSASTSRPRWWRGRPSRRCSTCCPTTTSTRPSR